MTSNTEYTKMRNVKDCYVGDVNFIINWFGLLEM